MGWRVLLFASSSSVGGGNTPGWSFWRDGSLVGVVRFLAGSGPFSVSPVVSMEPPVSLVIREEEKEEEPDAKEEEEDEEEEDGGEGAEEEEGGRMERGTFRNSVESSTVVFLEAPGEAVMAPFSAEEDDGDDASLFPSAAVPCSGT